MTPEFTGMLRDAGMRVTRPRLLVLDSLAEHPHAQTAAVLAAVREREPAISHQAVYDSLAALAEAGLVRRIQPAGSVARYELCVGDNHHHVVCRGCGRVDDVDCAVSYTPCLTPSENHGYAIDEAEVTYWGMCPTCLNSPHSN